MLINLFIRENYVRMDLSCRELSTIKGGNECIIVT